MGRDACYSKQNATPLGERAAIVAHYRGELQKDRNWVELDRSSDVTTHDMVIWRKNKGDPAPAKPKQRSFEEQVDTTLFCAESLAALGTIEAFRGLLSAKTIVAADQIAVLARRARLQSIAAGLGFSGMELSEAMVAQCLARTEHATFSSEVVAAINGYARAYDIIAGETGPAELKASMIRHLHRELFSFSEDDSRHCGSYRGRPLVHQSSAARDGGLIGSVPPHEIHQAVEELVSWWNAKTAVQCLSPIHQVAAFVGRFLVIAPFARGNHRLALLLAGFLLRLSGHDYLGYVSLERMMLKAGASFTNVLTPARGQPPLTKVDWEALFQELAWTLEHGLRAFTRRAKRVRQLPADLSPVDTKILSAFVQQETLCNRDLVELTALNRNTLKLHLRNLVARGLLTLQGAGRGARYQPGQRP